MKRTTTSTKTCLLRERQHRAIGDPTIAWLTTRPTLSIGSSSETSMVHPFAVVDENAILGPETDVWQGAYLGPFVRTGARCCIGSCVWIGPNSVLGNDVRIQHGAFIPAGTLVGNRVFIGPNVTLCDDKYPRVNNKMAYHAEPPVVEHDVSIGAGAVILPGVTIGSHALIGAGAVVTKSVSPAAVMVGVPASPHELTGAAGSRHNEEQGVLI